MKSKDSSRARAGGDDLEDNFEWSGDEGLNAAMAPSGSDSDSSLDSDGEEKPAKRKPEPEPPTEEELAARREKKRKKFAELKAKKKAKAAAAKSGVQPDIETLPEELQAEYLWKLFASEFPGEDTVASKTEALSAAHVVKFHYKSRGLDRLVASVKQVLPTWKKDLRAGVLRPKDTPRGAPTVVIVSPGARRCVELLKPLAEFRVFIAKLFAKHMSVEDQLEMLRQPTTIAVGTSARLLKLTEVGALDWSLCKVLIVDLARGDKGALFEQRDPRVEFFKLFREVLLPEIRKEGSHMKIGLY